MFEGIYSSENSPILKLGLEWKEIITDPNTIDIYFNVINLIINFLFIGNI